MAVEERIQLAAIPSSARAARRFVVDALTRAGLDDLCDDAALCVSELVTNAVLYAGTSISVLVRVDGPAVRVEVTDHSVAELAPRERAIRSGEAVTGRGVLLVAAVADRMGSDPSPEGKIAWFELHAVAARRGGTGVPLLTASVAPAPTGARVHIRDVPVALILASEDHIDSLVRETQLALATADATPHAEGPPSGPAALSEGLARYASARSAARDAAERARGRGDVSVDIEYYVPAEIAEEGSQFLALLDLADDLSRQGHLLTLPAAEEVAAFRRWFVGENARQALGGSTGTRYPSP